MRGGIEGLLWEVKRIFERDMRWTRASREGRLSRNSPAAIKRELVISTP